MDMEKKTVYQGFFSVDVVEMPEGPREVVRTTDSVSILIYDEINERIILVKQARASMMTNDNPEGLILETVAGRIDKPLPLEDIIIDEVLKEAGVRITKQDIVLLNAGQAMAVSAGAMTEKSYLAFVVIKPNQMEEDRVFGDSDEGERIVRVCLSLDKLKTYICEDIRVFALIEYLRKVLLMSYLERLGYVL